MKYIATNIQIAPSGGFKGFGKLGLQGSLATNASLTFSNLMTSVIGVLTIVAIIWFVFLLITGGIGYMSAGGDKSRIESASKRVTNALVGLVVVVISIFIVKLIGYLLGMPDILNFVTLFAKISGTYIVP
jgi:hypothetical protein